MHKQQHISIIVAIAATAALLIAASTLAPAAFAHKHKHSSVNIHQSIRQSNDDCSHFANCQNAAVNQANVNSHDNNAVAVNIHDLNLR
jgi:hypothetical protein